MLTVSGSYRNYQKCAVSIQLTDLPHPPFSMEEGGGGGGVCWAWRNLENNALSSLHKLLRNRLMGRGRGYSIAGSVTINAKMPEHCSPVLEFLNNLWRLGTE